MPDWTISAPGLAPTSAHKLAAQRSPAVASATSRRTWILTGEDQAGLAAVAELALHKGHRVVLAPPATNRPNTSRQHAGPPTGLHLPAGLAVNMPGDPRNDPSPVPIQGTSTRDGWDLALFSSGSTTGRPRGYGFTHAQLTYVTGWYENIYRATGDSVIVTALPAHYNFTVIAGVLLAARLGARFHLTDSPSAVLKDAECLTATADRVIVLANPVVLDQARPSQPLPPTVMIDSGGAPLSTTAIADYRAHGIDVREGYGLTETASLTHFDTTATAASLGTVGRPMPGATVQITPKAGLPFIEVSSPAIAVPLDPDEPTSQPALCTNDLGHIDEHGHLRILGRADDHPIAGLWPRDTLDAIGPLLGRRCALVRHPTHDHVTIHTLTPVSHGIAQALTDRAADLLDLAPNHIKISNQEGAPLLHSAKLTRHTTATTTATTTPR
jgi:acyl-CoA synthetase (AMP-forming)/AMP-acid ligase II